MRTDPELTLFRNQVGRFIALLKGHFASSVRHCIERTFRATSYLPWKVMIENGDATPQPVGTSVPGIGTVLSFTDRLVAESKHQPGNRDGL